MRTSALAAASADAETKAAESALDFARQELSRAETLRKSDTVPERLFDERVGKVFVALQARVAPDGRLGAEMNLQTALERLVKDIDPAALAFQQRLVIVMRVTDEDVIHRKRR